MSDYVSEWEAGLPRIERIAVVTGRPDDIDSYMPRNYHVLGTCGYDQCIIGGFDDAGWTLEDYIIPRLASGLHRCIELVQKDDD